MCQLEESQARGALSVLSPLPLDLSPRRTDAGRARSLSSLQDVVDIIHKLKQGSRRPPTVDTFAAAAGLALHPPATPARPAISAGDSAPSGLVLTAEEDEQAELERAIALSLGVAPPLDTAPGAGLSSAPRMRVEQDRATRVEVAVEAVVELEETSAELRAGLEDMWPAVSALQRARERVVLQVEVWQDKVRPKCGVWGAVTTPRVVGAYWRFAASRQWRA